MAARLPSLRRTKWIQPTWSITFTVPVQVVSEANARCHWAARKRRFDDQAYAVRMCWPGCNQRGPMVVTLTKLGGKKLDTDNLAGSMKAIRDQIAALLGIDDGDDRLTWQYGQSPGGEVGVRVEIRGK